MARWRDTLEGSAGNLARIDSQITNHVSVLASMPVGALSPDDVEAWLSERKTNTGQLLARSTLKKLRSIIAQAYDWGIKRRYVRFNPARVADLPRDATTTREGRALTPEEALRLIEHAQSQRLGAWVILGLTLGLRPGECSGLQWPDVDLKRKRVVIHQSLGTDGRLKRTKTGRTRTLALPGIAVEALKAHQCRQDEERRLAGDWPARYSGYVFLNSYGRPLDRSNTRRMVQAMARRAGVGDLNPYDLRHTASELMSETASEWKLADALGHRDTDTVQRHYRHPETSVITVAADYWESR